MQTPRPTTSALLIPPLLLSASLAGSGEGVASETLGESVWLGEAGAEGADWEGDEDSGLDDDCGDLDAEDVYE